MGKGLRTGDRYKTGSGDAAVLVCGALAFLVCILLLLRIAAYAAFFLFVLPDSVMRKKSWGILAAKFQWSSKAEKNIERKSIVFVLAFFSIK